MSSFSMKKFYPANQEYEIDPVCEMKVDPQNPPFRASYKGKTYYFCSKICKDVFQRYPDKYIGNEKDNK